MMRKLLLATVVAALTGCSSDANLTVRDRHLMLGPGLVALTLDKSSYSKGELVTVTMTNNSEQALGYNLCTRSFDRLVGDSWVAMPTELRLCTLQLDGLPAGAVRSGVTDLHGDAVPGTYRMKVGFSRDVAGEWQTVTATSPGFSIQ